jgi:hypothetical protein
MDEVIFQAFPSLEDTHGTWRSATAYIGKIARQFSLELLAMADIGQRTDIAVDSVEMAGCGQPEPTSGGCDQGGISCPSENGVCLSDQSRLCDFADDCGDESDERDCSKLCSAYCLIDKVIISTLNKKKSSALKKKKNLQHHLVQKKMTNSIC